MINYALTGSTGILGTALMRLKKPESIYTGDIRDSEEVSTWIRGLNNVDAIIHLAALVPKQIVDNDPVKAFETNVGGTLNILETLRKMKNNGLNTPWFFYASTSHVYSPSPTPVNEISEKNPFTLYGLTKLQGEQWCEAYAREFNISLCIGRIFSFSAPGQPDYYFLPAMCKRIREAKVGEKLCVSGVHGYRDFMRVSQICDSIERLSEKRYEGAVNIGSGYGHKLSDLVIQIARHLERDDVIFEFPEGTSESLVADNTLLKSLGVLLKCEIDELIDEIK